MQLFPALPEVVQGTFRPEPFGRLERRGGSPCERGIFIVDHTTNYQLSQWETTDRILMSDFNTDNNKIDAALKANAEATAALTQTVGTKADASALTAEVSARAAADTALGDRISLQAIYTQSISAATGTIYAPLPEGLNWSQWKTVWLLFTPVLASGSSYSAMINHSNSYLIGQQVTGKLLVQLFPPWDSSWPVCGLSWASQSKLFSYADLTYGAITRFSFQSSASFQVGTQMRLLGEKG